MPFINAPSFQPSFYLSNAHLQTIYPALFRKVEGVNYQRKRLELSDGDFLDLDFSKVPDNYRSSRRIVVVLHGLEGSADRPYVKGMVKRFNQGGWDGVGINFRGCSGTPNRLARTYHSGASEDLHEVIEYLVGLNIYETIAIIGFSLGGNITLKYVGERGVDLHPDIACAVAFSVPVHLESSSYELARWQNKLYMNRFMRSLKEKIKSRESIIKDKVDLSKVYNSKSFLDFDQYYTAPVHGFRDAVDYWTQSSSLQFLPNIRIPSLLVNAQDDSFLSQQCYPSDVASVNKNFYLQAPKNGGHVGFYQPDEEGFYWSERRAFAFCEAILSDSD
jgi:predicted alpha/beta-fold hydrolase